MGAPFEIVMLDRGIHRGCIERRQALLAAVIAEWVRAHGPVATLRIELKANDGVPAHEDPGGLSIRCVAREPDYGPPQAPIPGDMIPVLVTYDDGCGGDGGLVFVRADGSLIALEDEPAAVVAARTAADDPDDGNDAPW